MTYSSTASATTTLNRSKYKPHDKLPIRVVKTALNFSNAESGADQGVNCMLIPGGSVILAVNVDVTTIEGATVPFDIGFGAAGEEFLINGASNTTAQVVCLGVPYLVTSAANITVTPDATKLNAAVMDVYAVYVEFDSLSAAT
jgi:hypothetical protein